MDKFQVRKSFFCLLLAGFVLTASGCFYLVIGGVGALGGYAISPDTVEGVVNKETTQDLWQAAVEVISIMGIIQEQNEVSGVLIAQVQGAYITITVTESPADSVKLRVKIGRAHV